MSETNLSVPMLEPIEDLAALKPENMRFSWIEPYAENNSAMAS